MAPRVTVPCDFGREYIGSPEHSNLKLKLDNGKELLVNSMIVSYNSPIIHNLTTNLQQTSLDMDDFEEVAVNCFIDCLYTGDIELLNKHIFRHVYKMANVFDVAWLVAKCVEYFTEDIESESYEEILFLFEEARYVANTLKQDNLLDLVVQKIRSTVEGIELFFGNYLRHFNDLSIGELDVVLKMTGTDNYIIEFITSYLGSPECLGLTTNCRHLLINSNLALCRKTNCTLYESLFGLLGQIKNLSPQDWQTLYKLRLDSTMDNNSHNSNTKSHNIKKDVKRLINNKPNASTSLKKAMTSLKTATKPKSTSVTLLSEKTLFLGQKLTVIKGNIATVGADAIIHPTNSNWHMMGACGNAIRDAAGPDYLEEVSDIAAAHGPLKPSEAMMSSSRHNLSCEHVIHVNGPEYGEGGQVQQVALQRTIQNALSLADRYKFTSIAFPSVSSGQNGFPKQTAAHLILKAISNYFVSVMASTMRQVYFVLYDQESVDSYTNELANLD